MQGKRFSPLIWLIIVFLLPLLGSGVAILFKDQIKTSQKGELITPTEINLQKAHNITKLPTLINTPATSHKWRVIFLTDRTCDKNCTTIKDELNKMHTLLRTDQNRVLLLEISKHCKHMQPYATSKFLIVNPDDQIILRYNEKHTMQNLLHDLMRLLKYSHV